MKTMLATLLLVASAVSVLAAERPQLRDSESPRATDLLRAERLAEEARKRLALPRRKTARWVRGGSGWTARAEPDPKTRPIQVHVRRTPRRRAAR